MSKLAGKAHGQNKCWQRLNQVCGWKTILKIILFSRCGAHECARHTVKFSVLKDAPPISVVRDKHGSHDYPSGFVGRNIQKIKRNSLIIFIYHEACKNECRVLSLYWSHSLSRFLTLSMSWPRPCQCPCPACPWPNPCTCPCSIPVTAPVLVRGPCPLPFPR